MKFKPIPPARNCRPIAYVISTDGDAVFIEGPYGGRWYRGKLEVFKGFYAHMHCAIYSLVNSNQLLRCYGDLRKWQVVKFNRRTVKYLFDGKIGVYPLSIYNASPDDANLFFSAIAQYGVAPNSYSTMAKNLWLRTLSKEVWIKEWSNMNVGRKAFVGGRKEAKGPPTEYNDVAYLDLPAAYLQEMKAPLPLWLREDKVEWYDNGIALAEVKIPKPNNFDFWWGPLPQSHGTIRNVDIVRYGANDVRGFWSLNELRYAKDQGAQVNLERVWRGYREKALFDGWLGIAFDLRSLPGPAGRIAKHVTTRLWSLFGVNPNSRKSIIHFKDPKNSREQDELFIRPSIVGDGTTFLSSMIASRVRVRVARELLSIPGTLFVDTDGGIVPNGIRIPGWNDKWKGKGELVQIRSSQSYRYRCTECGTQGGHPEWHYSIAGIDPNTPNIEEIFNWTSPKHMIPVGRQILTLPNDGTIPVGGEIWNPIPEPIV